MHRRGSITVKVDDVLGLALTVAAVDVAKDFKSIQLPSNVGGDVP